MYACHVFGRAYLITYIHTYIHPCMHTYIHAYIHTYIHIHIHTFIHTYIHTYVNTYLPFSRWILDPSIIGIDWYFRGSCTSTVKSCCASGLSKDIAALVEWQKVQARVSAASPEASRTAVGAFTAIAQDVEALQYVSPTNRKAHRHNRKSLAVSIF